VTCDGKIRRFRVLIIFLKFVKNAKRTKLYLKRSSPTNPLAYYI